MRRVMPKVPRLTSTDYDRPQEQSLVYTTELVSAAFARRYWSNDSYSKIADDLGISIEEAKKAVSKKHKDAKVYKSWCDVIPPLEYKTTVVRVRPVKVEDKATVQLRREADEDAEAALVDGEILRIIKRDLVRLEKNPHMAEKFPLELIATTYEVSLAVVQSIDRSRAIFPIFGDAPSKLSAEILVALKMHHPVSAQRAIDEARAKLLPHQRAIISELDRWYHGVRYLVMTNLTYNDTWHDYEHTKITHGGHTVLLFKTGAARLHAAAFLQAQDLTVNTLTGFVE